ncbi:hypothetical protein QO001_001432 [Methylobacterium brachiatum]|uniref:AAA+ ATPase domain-containing protein n=1 Tax=Methylobacterium brachiatum TaxID=269660 RepID=A0AAJ1TPH8_9HYPH|nr:AAA family ATPase [Methylobacterium brachiatum]MCB4802172.1 AAA family ATPase [Methylobacterium brachiatum]MDQ0542514.1 hypothetical protein [Methylobacterium brachiatum]
MARTKPTTPPSDDPTAEEFLTGDLAHLAARQADPDDMPYEEVETLAGILVHDALTPGKRLALAAPDGAAVVVRVPSPDWVDSVAAAMRSHTTFADMLIRTGASRTQDRPEVGCDRVSARLARGGRVCGISQDPERFLPASLVAGADVRLDLAQPTPGQVARAIQAVTGEDPGPMPPLHGLGHHDYVAALRTGSTAAACLARLQAAARSRSVVDPDLPEAPLLHEMPGLEGEARDWTLALADDFQAYLAGRIDFDAIARHAVFCGEPGTGKTLLARSVARTLGVPLIETSVASWFTQTQGYLGDVVREVSRVFSAAAAAAPAVLFLDEADGLPNRGRLDNRNRDFWKPIIGQVLLQLDGATSGKNGKIIVIAGTNHVEDLDPALVRPGRLSRVITVRKPSVPGLADILRHHLGPDVLPGADLTGVAALGVGATGADAAAWAQAARRTARVADRPVAIADLMRLVAPEDDRTPAEALACARHEIAHACAVEALGVGEVRTVTTVKSGEVAGLTRTKLATRLTMTRAQIEDYVVATLCGRAADEEWGEATTGAGGPAGSDLGMATRTLAAAHASFGLGGTLLHRASDADAHRLLAACPDLRRLVSADLDRLYARSRDFVQAHRDAIDGLAHRLVDERLLTGAVIRDRLAEDRGAPRTKGGRRARA